MFDETQEKIIDATMNLVMEKGYSATTTKDIASRAEINECTIFRKFNGKKDIIISAMTLSDWNPKLKKEDFVYSGDLETDLVAFASIYLSKVTTKMVKVSLGLRSPDLFSDTKDGIMEVPGVMKDVLVSYFSWMKDESKVRDEDIEGMAIQFLSTMFGFVFFKASFGDQLTSLQQEEYVKKSVGRFIQGII